MGSCTTRQGQTEATMRCRTPAQVPKCFSEVKCPYPEAQTCNGRYGAINYSLVGPATGEVVLCLHGLNGSRLLFQDFADVLSNDAGFRVLSFDLYGHGLSNAAKVEMCPSRCCATPSCSSVPRARYDLDFFVDQVDELLELVGIGQEPVNIVGFSLGGSIALAFARKFPDRVLRVAAMSPAGALPTKPKVYYLLQCFWCCLIPLAPHVVCTYWCKREQFSRSMKKEGSDMDAEAVDHLWQKFVWQLYVKRGVASATLAVLHRIPWFNLRSLFCEVGQHPRPVLLIWGEKDSLNPVHTTAQQVCDCFSNARLLVVKDAGHIALCDQPKQVILSIIAFLRLPVDVRVSQVKLVLPFIHRLQPKALPAKYRSKPPGASAYSASDAAALRQKIAERASEMPVPMILGHSEDVHVPALADLEDDDQDAENLLTSSPMV
mmetsp:Transcript_42376/g.76932  ORF Transcript_42376/g.76932 Transcript_42376/m.76932 type:complete len:433 (+) Transcript_42376:41-1339(+)